MRGFNLVAAALILAGCVGETIWSASVQAGESDPVRLGAQKEGELVTWAVGEIQFQTMVVDRFKKKYPFICKVDAVRLGSEALRNRLLAEAQAEKRATWISSA